MKAASTDDRFQDDKKGDPILTEGALSYREDGAGGAHLPGRMGPGGPIFPVRWGQGGPIEGGPQNFMTPDGYVMHAIYRIGVFKVSMASLYNYTQFVSTSASLMPTPSITRSPTSIYGMYLLN